MRRPIPERSRGFALMLVIWSLVIMLGLSAGFAMAVRHETRIASDLVDAARIDASAIAARNLALLALNHRDAAQRWRPDGQARLLTYDGLRIAVRVRSETGRIDLNRAPRPVLVGLIEQVAPDRDFEALADAIIDWRDRDERPSPSGAEADEYRDAGLSYTPPNQHFRSVQELGRVLGFDSDVSQALAPFVTVHSRRPRINAMSAEPTVLAAIPGVDPATAERFIAERGQSLLDGTPPPIELLQDGRRYVEMQMDARVILMDVAVLPIDKPIHLEQVVMGMDTEQSYTLLSRNRLSAADTDRWWRP